MIDQIVKDIAEIRKEGYDIRIEMGDEMWHKLTREFPLQASLNVETDACRFRGIDIIRDKIFSILSFTYN